VVRCSCVLSLGPAPQDPPLCGSCALSSALRPADTEDTASRGDARKAIHGEATRLARVGDWAADGLWGRAGARVRGPLASGVERGTVAATERAVGS
jgi:hypothetical protein